jgi:hypothetical protein
VATSLLDWLEEGQRDAHRCFLDGALGEDRLKDPAGPKTASAGLSL